MFQLAQKKIPRILPSFWCNPSHFFRSCRYFVQTPDNRRPNGMFNATYRITALRRDFRGLVQVSIKLYMARDLRKAHGGELLIQRHRSWIRSQPTYDEEVAPLNYLQWKNKESLARWRNKVNALAAAGNYPYPTN
jgi:hypothetical protein